MSGGWPFSISVLSPVAVIGWAGQIFTLDHPGLNATGRNVWTDTKTVRRLSIVVRCIRFGMSVRRPSKTHVVGLLTTLRICRYPENREVECRDPEKLAEIQQRCFNATLSACACGCAAQVDRTCPTYGLSGVKTSGRVTETSLFVQFVREAHPAPRKHRPYIRKG